MDRMEETAERVEILGDGGGGFVEQYFGGEVVEIELTRRGLIATEFWILPARWNTLLVEEIRRESESRQFPISLRTHTISCTLEDEEWRRTFAVMRMALGTRLRWTSLAEE